MAKAQYKEWLKPEKLLVLQGWKRDGLRDEDIATKIGITPRTFERWKSEHSQIRQAIKNGKEVVNYLIENELYKKALSGNMTAIIFWLKNNWREKYNDSTLSTEELRQVSEKTRHIRLENELLQLKIENFVSLEVSDDDDITAFAFDRSEYNGDT